MGATRRAVRALMLLMGFYGMGFGLLAVLVAVNAAVLSRGGAGAFEGRLLIFSCVVAIPVVRGIFFTRAGNRMRKPPGVAVSPHQQPALWHRVADLARLMGTRPPRELRIVPDVNAFVHENAWLGGLLPGRRRMFVGAPLLIGLTPAQLDVVLCHELGHYSNKDTRLTALVRRGRDSMLTTVRLFAGRRTGRQVLFRLYHGYAMYFLRTTQAMSRQQELAADREAVRIAGRANTALALRQLAAVEAAFDFYEAHYLTAGEAAGLLPRADELLGGFRHLLASPARAAELAEVRANPPEREPSPYDSHPPLHERIAVIEALPDDGRGTDTGSALSLVADPAGLFAAVARDMLARSGKPEKTAGLREADWATLAREAGRAKAARSADPLAEAARAFAPAGDSPGSWAALRLVLDLADAGRLDELADKLPEPQRARGTSGPVRAQHLRTDLQKRLLDLAKLALAEIGRADWPLDWSEVNAFEAPGIAPAQLQAAVRAVVAYSPDTAPLRRLTGC